MENEYYKNEESVKEYINLAKDVNGGKLIDELKQHLQTNATILELGSGPGTDWNILQKNYSTTGSDFSNQFLNHLKLKNPLGEFLKLDASTLITDKKFDGIYANKVLHHLTDDELRSSIKRQAEILNPEGIICLSFWEGKGTEVFKGMFVNYHNIETLKKSFEPYFEIITLKLYNEFENDDSLLLIGRKK
jgi:trans-aconitate methyltransferase